MDSYLDARLVEALNHTSPCMVRLADDRLLRVLNIAWGYDLGDDHAHVTTNISPSEAGADIDFFFTCEIEELSDCAGRVLIGDLHPDGSCSRCI
jgi:hypothetical protein